MTARQNMALARMNHLFMKAERLRKAGEHEKASFAIGEQVRLSRNLFGLGLRMYPPWKGPR